MGTRIDRRFDILRQKANQQVNQQDQESQAALERKAAAQGQSGSGAFIKLEQQRQDQIAGQRQSALGDVEAQREAALAQQDELEAQRKFAREERMGGQDFAAQQAAMQRGWQGEQAQAQRDFEGAQAQAGRDLQKRMFDKDMKFKNSVQKASNSQFKKQMDMAMQQFEFDKHVSNFNMRMAEKMANKKDLFTGFGSFWDTGRNKVEDEYATIMGQ